LVKFGDSDVLSFFLSIIYPVRNIDALVNVPAKENQVCELNTLIQLILLKDELYLSNFRFESSIVFAGSSQEISASGMCPLCT
jgi:hypothetical protein